MVHQRVPSTAVMLLLAATVTATVTGCSSSNFGASPARKVEVNGKVQTGGDTPPATANAPGTSSDASSDPAQMAAPDHGGGTGNGNGTTGDVAGGPGLLGATEASCLRKSALYNVVMVFDVSGSQAQTDPTKLRVSGAKDFLTKLSSFADANPASKFNVSITGFASDATFGAHGWEALNKTTLADMTLDIDKVTAKESAGTHYLAALTATDQLLTKINASATDKTTRTFVIFMTDGEPNGPGTLNQINAATAALTTTRGAAMIMLGTGTGVSANGEKVLQGMALPNPGIVNPKHVGRYHRVATTEQMAKIGEILTGDVAACE
ncbi:MAG: VWA domain-containing protein [Proteobacteria bacterium]|nr:VWA domain-containing protein [Pseudomonadota bacterium]